MKTKNQKNNHLEKDEVEQETNQESRHEGEDIVDIDPMNLALARIQTLETALKDAENDKYRALADAQNMKKRIAADFEQRSKYVFKSAALELIAVFENLQRAYEQSNDLATLQKGLELAISGFNQVLTKEGVVKIDALHQPFNPELHQALVVEESDEFKPETVIEVYQDGYMLKDRLLRASMVKVSKEKEGN
ncbi:MAG: nucleotide exchange factor GrpE [Erysipelothrix sp.]|jgi:molecular chaperone GrpE|nr:nucleotide exchange factor GrpE [Erysipelothrix sp.]